MAENEIFTVGEASPANTFLAIWMAKDAGLYAAQGLDVAIVKTVGGSQTGPDLTDGTVDLMHIGLSSSVRARAAGADLRTIGSLSNLVRGTFFAAPGIETAADIRGKAVGISSVGSESDPTATLALRQLGLERSDVTFKEIGTQRLGPLRAGEVALTSLGEPYRSEAFALGLKAMADLYAERIPWLYSGLAVHRRTITERRDSLVRFMKATAEGNRLAIHDGDYAKRVLAQALDIGEPAIAAKSYDNFRAETPRNCEMTNAGAQTIIDLVAPPEASHKIEDYLDPSILDGLEGDGYFAALTDRYGTP
jgi:NitT/TauT family transport system substrate-binding protein